MSSKLYDFNDFWKEDSPSLSGLERKIRDIIEGSKLSDKQKKIMKEIPEIRDFKPRYEFEGFFSVYFADRTYMEIPFFDLLEWVCRKDSALMEYLQGLPPEYSTYEEVEELMELGFDFLPKISGYLKHCEARFPGYIYEFSLPMEDLPPEYI